MVLRLGDVGIVGVPNEASLAVWRVSSDGELGMLLTPPGVPANTVFDGTGGTSEVGGEDCCCCNWESWKACLFVVDTTTGSLMTEVEKASCALEGLLTCRFCSKRRPNEAFVLGDFAVEAVSGGSTGPVAGAVSARGSSADFSDTRRLNNRLSLLMPFDPADGTLGRSTVGSSGDLFRTRVSITVIVAGGGVSDSFRCGEGAVYCSR